MQKQAPTLGRILVMAGFALSCFGLLLYLWVAFGGGSRSSRRATGSTPLRARRRSSPAGGRAHLRRARRQGRKAIGLDAETARRRDDPARQRYAPIPKDARAILRPKTLLGETYVELTPGTPDARTLPEGGHAGGRAVADTVELDEILRTFDPQTREAFQDWMQSLAEAIDGRGADLNDAFGNLGPFAEDTTELLEMLNRRSRRVQGCRRNTGVVFDALSRRSGELAT